MGRGRWRWTTVWLPRVRLLGIVRPGRVFHVFLLERTCTAGDEPTPGDAQEDAGTEEERDELAGGGEVVDGGAAEAVEGDGDLGGGDEDGEDSEVGEGGEGADEGAVGGPVSVRHGFEIQQSAWGMYLTLRRLRSLAQVRTSQPALDRSTPTQTTMMRMKSSALTTTSPLLSSDTLAKKKPYWWQPSASGRPHQPGRKVVKNQTATDETASSSRKEQAREAGDARSRRKRNGFQ
jgi:hypothetical protein